MNSPQPCGRFAPSPTGPLHAGSLLAAFGSWLWARHAGGQWHVRIEDVDPPRTVPGAASAQLAVLDQFGLHADGPIVRQSQRGPAYQQALQHLLATDQAFICHCSRSDLAATGGLHHHCVERPPRPDPAVRLRVRAGSVIAFHDAVRGLQTQDVYAEVGDFVLRRADGCWAYQLAVVVDDAALGVSEVVRGADLIDSTARQILLQRALGLPTPRYAHLPLLRDADGKLSKSRAAAAVDAADVTAQLRWFWERLGQACDALPPGLTGDALLAVAAAAFAPERVPRHDITLAQTPPMTG